MGNKAVGILVGVVALGGVAYLISKGVGESTDGSGGFLGNGGSGSYAPASGNGDDDTVELGDCEQAYTDEGDRRSQQWWLVGSDSAQQDQNVCDLAGCDIRVYQDRTAYLPGEQIYILVLAKYRETHGGSSDWWPYCGGVCVDAYDLYGTAASNEHLYTKIRLTFPGTEDVAHSIVGKSSNPNPDYWGATAREKAEEIAVAGGMTASEWQNSAIGTVVSDSRCRDTGGCSGQNQTTNKYGASIWVSTAPLSPGAYDLVVSFWSPYQNLTGPWNCQEKLAKVRGGSSVYVVEADCEDIAGDIAAAAQEDALEGLSQTAEGIYGGHTTRFHPAITYQSNHAW